MSGDYETHNNQQPHINYAGSKVDLDKYALFVDGVTSDPSKDYKSFIKSLSTLDGEGSNIHRLLTAAVGISAEGGEFMEIVKKMVFQGKPWNHDNREHLIIELGDEIFCLNSLFAATPPAKTIPFLPVSSSALAIFLISTSVAAY